RIDSSKPTCRQNRCCKNGSDHRFRFPSGPLIWDGEAYGWKNVLRDPQHERPGAIAVDAEGNMFIAEGGNDYDGAKCWVVFQEF
ncbi:hypothetical protein, partial [Raoultella ornithinolytica]|uniref:hypothetical protein n=1 Tax=Raoultella ornithinolytica TaxID=54291 RepID=UPI0039B65D80